VAQHEPHFALFAPQADPLYYYRLLAHRLRVVLSTIDGSYKSIKPIEPGPASATNSGKENARRMELISRNQTKTMYLEMPSGCAGAIQRLFQEFHTEIRADAQGIERMLRVGGMR
jgi:hypothetical protein